MGREPIGSPFLERWNGTLPRGLVSFTVCVDYSDYLAATLPYNEHHFYQSWVITSPDDWRTEEVALDNGAYLYKTDAFYHSGAKFNKWKALEECIASVKNYYNDTWFCFLDADVLWPQSIEQCTLPIWWSSLPADFIPGYLYVPMRRMLIDWDGVIPPEEDWKKCPLHKNDGEFAGYSQIFHTSDEHLGPLPWHEIDWIHAGGADSFFQMKWSNDEKIRPPFEVLHLGHAGVNWMGRVTPYLDGTSPPGAKERHAAMSNMFAKRRQMRNQADRFIGEKIRKNS